MRMLDGFWKYAQSDWPAPILSLSAGTTQTDEFQQLVRSGLVREGERRRFIECPCCRDHDGEPQASELPDGTIHFLLACPNCGGVEVTEDDMRAWGIHFSALPGIVAAKLGMRDPQSIVSDTLWKMGRYGDSGDIWMARWLQYPEAKDWFSKIPKTPHTILLYLGPPPDFGLLAGIPQGNVIDASELISVDDAGFHVDKRLIDAALYQGAFETLSLDACVFRKAGDYWQLSFAGKKCLHRDMIGMAYINYLIAQSPKSVSSLELRKTVYPDFRSELLGSAGEILDEQALKQLHKRLDEIPDEKDEAGSHQDFGKLRALVEEEEALKEQLRKGLGLGGRKRRGSDDLERNRKAVGKAIKEAIKSISDVHPELGRHLKTLISSGDHCSYQQEPGMVWST
jgi:hypothetical protein